MGAVVHVGSGARFLEKERQKWNVPEIRARAQAGAGSGPGLVGGRGMWVAGQPVAQTSHWGPVTWPSGSQDVQRHHTQCL